MRLAMMQVQQPQADISPATVRKYFVIAVLAHLFCWTVLPLFLQSNAALDMLEGLAWGKEWQLGYEKDPPLFPWVIQVLTQWSGKGLWISYLAGQLCVATVFFAVWQLGQRVASVLEALIGALLLEGVYYLSLPTLELNDIVLQMPFSALFGWLLHKAIRADRLADWILAGVVASLGLWSRYSMGAYIVPIAIFAVIHPFSRSRLRSKGPWFLILVCTLLFLPHLYWIVETDFISLKYVGHRAPQVHDTVSFLTQYMAFIGAQVLALLPLLLVSLLLWRWRATKHWLRVRWEDFDFSYIATLALGPAVFSLVLSFSAQRPLRAMWGAPLWLFLGLFIVLLLRPVITRQRLHCLRRAWLLLLLFPMVYFVAEKKFGTAITGNEQAVNFPGNSLGQAINTRWRTMTGRPLKYVVGNTWTAGNVAFYARDRPSVIFSHGDQRLSPWAEAGDVRQAGAVIVWNVKLEGAALPAYLASRFPGAVLQPSVTVTGKLPHQFGIAYVMPQ
ncbi:MAG: glycosyltransferase family 39 protein [Janthinobacterium svalbardensis]